MTLAIVAPPPPHNRPRPPAPPAPNPSGFGLAWRPDLCTDLAPAAPSYEDVETWIFRSPLIHERVLEKELIHLHEEMARDGLPYTVQHCPVVPRPRIAPSAIDDLILLAEIRNRWRAQ